MNLSLVTRLEREVRRLKRELAVARSVNRATEHLIRCTDPARHLRLCHDLEQANARLAELEGHDPHLASLEVVK